MIRKITGILVTLVLAAGLIYQSVEAIQYLSGQYRNKLLGNRNLDSFARSADASYGGEFEAYVSFLRSSIPENAKVVIPPTPASGYPINDLFVMQYLLFPRQLETCPSDCGSLIAEPWTYILTEQDFPPADQVPTLKQLVIFNGQHGLYAPGK